MTDWGGMGGLKECRTLEEGNPFEAALEAAIGDRIRASDPDAAQAWGALANIEWFDENGDTATYSFRAAGDLIAAIRKSGTYLDWYCEARDTHVEPWIAKAMKAHGWRWRLY